jgi:hypothetical protein
MLNKINKERRRSMNATPTRPSNKSQWQGAQEDPKQKQDRAQGIAQAGKPLKLYSRPSDYETEKHVCQSTLVLLRKNNFLLYLFCLIR